MTRARAGVGSLLTLALLPLIASAVSADSERPRPNVVFILADDLGYSDLPAYRRALGLSTPFATPHLDRLASGGMLFLDAHQSASVCAPARFAVLTGSHHLRGRASWGIKALSAFDHGGPHRHRTVGELMQAAGYRTAFVGKEHLGGRALDADGSPTSQVASIDFSRTTGVAVTRGDGTRETRRVSRPDGLVTHGFDYTYSLSDGVGRPPYLFWENDLLRPIRADRPAGLSSVRYWDRQERIDRGNGDSRVPMEGPGDVDWDPVQVGRQLADAAVGFIDGHLREHPGVPFLLLYASHAIHPQSTPPLDFDGDPRTLDEPVRGTTPTRRTDMIVELDLEVGRILDALVSHGIDADTLVFFTSDNGGLKSGPPENQIGFTSTASLKGAKASPFEGGHRVPLLVRWGDGSRAGSRIPPGVVSSQLVAITDWVAALYDLTAQKMESDQVYDGASLLPLLFSEHPDAEPAIRRYQLIAQRGLGVRFDERDARTGVERRWFYFEGDPELSADRRLLFDLTDDPLERRDLLAGLPMVLETRGLSRKRYQRYRLVLPLVVHLGNWLHAHRGPGDLPTTARVDYTRAELRTPIPELP